MSKKISKQTVRVFSIIFLVILSLSTTNCGYQLRGFSHHKINISNINLDYAQLNYSEINDRFIHTLTNKLRARDIMVATHKTLKKNSKHKNKDIYDLTITSADFNKNIIATASSKLITQYKISYIIRFNLSKGDNPVLSNQIINTMRNYNYNEDQILGLNDEEDTITRELIQEATDRIIVQLIAIAK